MPDKRAHRGPAPQDAELFGPGSLPGLRQAAAHLAWLFTRGYAASSALALVGNRFDLTARQRRAVLRAACSDQGRDDRRHRRTGAAALRGATLWIDGYNVLTTVEAALAGGVVLLARDGSYRDMASMHGSWRKVAETGPALEHTAAALAALGVAAARWYLDRPVSNSGRLRALILAAAARADLAWTVDLVPDPDPVLAGADGIVASADAGILDACARWFGLARHVVERAVPAAWVVDLSGS